MRASTNIQSLVLRLRKDESGVITTEYAFLIAFVAIIAAIGMAVLGEDLQGYFTALGDGMEAIGDSLLDPPDVDGNGGGGIDGGN